MDQEPKQETQQTPEEIKSQILSEISEFKKEFGDNALREYFNNFGLNLPDENAEHKGLYRAVMQPFFDIPIGEYTKQKGIDLTEHSEVYKKQTPRQFFATVDQTLLESGIPMKELSIIQQDIKEKGSEHLEEYYELVTPVYIKLRQMGYSEADLTR